MWEARRLQVPTTNGPSGQPQDTFENAAWRLTKVPEGRAIKRLEPSSHFYF